jgi:hypothetical protein
METKTITKDALHALIDLYDLHTKLFFNVIEGVSDKDANNRLNTKANHPSWITGSLVHSRFELAKALGAKNQSTFHELFKDYKGLQENVTYPALKEYKKDWELISPVLKTALLNMTEEQLEGLAPFKMDGDVSFYEAISFMIDRESYCIGQLGLFRRLLGYEAMKYN